MISSRWWPIDFKAADLAGPAEAGPAGHRAADVDGGPVDVVGFIGRQPHSGARDILRLTDARVKDSMTSPLLLRYNRLSAGPDRNKRYSVRSRYARRRRGSGGKTRAMHGGEG